MKNQKKVGNLTMSKYTTELRYIVEEYAGLTTSVGQLNVNQTIAAALPKLFDFPFPIFDENYRTVLETKIVKHYYTREIGQESEGLWKLRLDTKLNEIMPYYNQLYKSELITFNPLYNIDYSTTNNRTNNTDKEDNNSGNTDSNNHNENVGTNHATTGNTNINVYSDTPQGALTNVTDDTYLTNATKDTSNGSNDSNSTNKVDGTANSNYTDKLLSTIKTTDDFLEHASGKNSGESFSDMLLKYRQTFLNIDMQVIDDLHDLFMLIW